MLSKLKSFIKYAYVGNKTYVCIILSGFIVAVIYILINII